MYKAILAALSFSLLVFATGGANAQTLPAGCVANQPCVQNLRTGAVFTNDSTFGANDGPHEPLRVALDNAQPGDTLMGYPAVYSEGDIPVNLNNILIDCAGTYPSPTGPGQCIRDPAAAQTDGGNPNGNVITYGLFRIGGASGLYVNVTIRGWQLQNATAATRTQHGVGIVVARSTPVNNVITVHADDAAELAVGDYLWDFSHPYAIPGVYTRVVAINGLQITLGSNSSSIQNTDQLHYVQSATASDTGSGVVSISAVNDVVVGDWVYDATNPAAIPATTIMPGETSNQTQITAINGNVLTFAEGTTIAANDILTFAPGSSPGWCNGVFIPPGHIRQCGGGNAAGVRMQGFQSATLDNVALLHNSDGILTTPFVYGQGDAICNSCIIADNGAADTQSHAWYAGRSRSAQLHNSIVIDTFDGELFKNRGFDGEATDNIIGDSDACSVPLAATGYTNWVGASTIGGTPAMQQAISPAKNGQGYGSGNAINNPDGGHMLVTDNSFCKSGTFSSNTAENTHGVAIPPWPNNEWVESGSKYYSTYTANNGQYVWDPAANNASQMSIDGLTIIGNAPGWGIAGLGSLTNSTLNGSAWNGCNNETNCPITYQTLDQSPTAAPLEDDRGTNDPKTVTSVGNGGEILGGNGRLTVNLTGVGSGVNVYPGPGGADVTADCVNSTGCRVGFLDQPGYAPSTYTEPQDPTDAFAMADGDVVNITDPQASTGYLAVGASVSTVNLCNNGTLGIGSPSPGSCGHLEFKSPFGNIAGGLVNYRFDGDDLICVNGCNVAVTGNVVFPSLSFYGYTADGASAGPATALINATLWNQANGVITASEAVNIAAQGCSYLLGWSNLNDFSNSVCSNFFYLTTLSQNVTLEGSTLDPGPATTTASAETDVNAGPQLNPAVVAGSGNLTLTLGTGPMLLEVVPTTDSGIKGGYNGDIMPKHTSGGVLNVKAYNSTRAPLTPIVLLGGLTSTCTDGTNTTINVSDGTSIVLLGGVDCALVNYTQPAGANDAALSGPASISGQAGQTVSVPVVAVDTWFANHSGEGFAAVQAGSGQMVFNGQTAASGALLSMAGRFNDIAGALSGLQIVLGAAQTDTITVHYWNAGGGTATLTIPVSAINPNDIVLQAPASLTVDSGTTTPLAGLLVSDSYGNSAGNSNTATLSASVGSITPASSTGSTDQVNTALAGAQYVAPLTGGSATIAFADSNNGGGAASVNIPVTVNWSAAWNDIQLTVPGPQTIVTGQAISLSSSTLADALSDQAGLGLHLEISSAVLGQIVDVNTADVATAEAVLQATTTAVYNTPGTDTLTVQVSNAAGYLATQTIPVTINPAVVNWPSTGGAQGPYTSNGTTYNCNGTTPVTTTITGTDNVFNAGSNGSITLTDNSGFNTLSPPGYAQGHLTLTNGSQWNTETYDLRTLLNSEGFVHGGDPSAFLRLSQQGQTAHLQGLGAGGTWVDKIVLISSGTVTLQQILDQAIIP